MTSRSIWPAWLAGRSRAIPATLAALAATLALAATASAGPILLGRAILPSDAYQAVRRRAQRSPPTPDLVATKDGHLIARHEPNILTTTDVASHPEFASRRRTAVIDGVSEEGFFVSDFTLAEIRTLRAVQPLAERPQEFNRRFKVPTLDEVLALARRLGRERGRPVGVYPETKHPTYHQKLGLPLEERLVRALRRAGLNRRSAPVFIQSFEQANLKQLNAMTPVPLVQLVDANDVNADGSLDYTAPSDRPYDWTVSGDPTLQARTFGYFATDAGLAEIATYADGIGPWKRYIVSTAAQDINGDGAVADENGDGLTNDADRRALPPTDLIARAPTLTGCSSTPGPSATRSAAWPTTTEVIQAPRTSSSSSSGSTACSPTSRTRPSRLCDEP